MQLFKISCITCLSALKETDHWLERQKRFNMVIFTVISNHISMLVHENSMCIICLSTGLFFFFRSFFSLVTFFHLREIITTVDLKMASNTFPFFRL